MTQIHVAWAIEAFFLICTYTILTRAGRRPIFHWGGTLLLCLTFCWSVILGCLIALRDITVQL